MKRQVIVRSIHLLYHHVRHQVRAEDGTGDWASKTLMFIAMERPHGRVWTGFDQGLSPGTSESSQRELRRARNVFLGAGYPGWRKAGTRVQTVDQSGGTEAINDMDEKMMWC